MNEYKYKEVFIKGITIGGIETCYVLPHFNLAFDVGRCPAPLIDVPRVFLTHGHLDHASGLPYYVSQRSLRRLDAPEIFMPATITPSIKKILDLWNKIEGYKAQSKLVPLSPNETVDVRKDHYIKAISAYHRVTCYGYILFRKSSKLKKEYMNLSSPEIVRLKRRGIDLFDKVDIPIFSFSGDTTIEFILNNEAVQKTKVLLLECTYIDEKRDVSRAREWGHTHLDEIVQNSDYFQNERLVLVHFSKRYTRKKIMAMIDQKLPYSLKEKTDVFLP